MVKFDQRRRFRRMIGKMAATGTCLAMSLMLVLTVAATTAVAILQDNLEELVPDQEVVRNMVRTFGRELSSVGTEQTCLAKIEENFQRLSAEVTWFDANKMMDDMRNDVMHMFNWKKHSVERIANESERLAANHTFDKNMEIDYYNVKRRDDQGRALLPAEGGSAAGAIPLTRNANFDGAMVNLDHSAIHVPINVYDKSPDVVNDIKWSEHLTQFFKNNLAFDPSLSWQFFGSARGFLRLYPAAGWREPPNYTDKPVVDLYDCRMRPWYIKGAASPKDLVILFDTSGSMTGLRKSIAQNVVDQILDTLTDDDYVAAFKFSQSVEPIDSCLDTLVQANKRNVDRIKSALPTLNTSDPPNFTAALGEAFAVLQRFNRSGRGSQCNQAIMLITDGAPATYEDVFRQYNWPNIPVRVFTYLIGHDVTAYGEVYWMACHNRGYFAHVMNQAGVREQVQKYIPVLSRPIVLSGQRVFSWTSIYAPANHLELTARNWLNKQHHDLYKRRRAQLGVTMDADQEHESGDGLEPTPPSLYTTLSTPVFDTRNYTNITKRILIKNVYQDAEIETIRIANLLGVAGVDIPIKEIEKLTPAFKLGVNGYSFLITNNGYLLKHPDLRPTFEGFLKPFYHSVDMAEVELANNTLGPREPDPEIESIRGNMINRTHGWKKVAVKVHLDQMKRVMTRLNHYTHGMIGRTPFSLAIALPEPYGSYRLTSQVDLRMRHREENFTHFFRGNQWRVHPQWAYCDQPHQADGRHPSPPPEHSILQFLAHDLEKQNFRWRTSSIRPKVYETILCDKDLIQSLVLDANLTDIPPDRCNSAGGANYRDEQRIKTFGIVSTFVATRSGLTRFRDYRSPETIKSLDEPPFYLKHNRAIEETYYRRAVDFHSTNRDAFVYSVEFGAGQRHEQRRATAGSAAARLADENFLVTATHALFIGNQKQSTPVAVVGVQFRYDTLHEFFLNTTNKFNVACTHLDVDCYLVDNNAFVVLANHRPGHVGQFFGQVDGDILEQLVRLGVYRRVHLYDYQAICLEPLAPESGPGAQPFLFSVLGQLAQLIRTTAGLLGLLYWNLLYGDGWRNIWAAHGFTRQNWIDAASSAPGSGGGEGTTIFTAEPASPDNITRAWPCDKEFDLYEMVDFSLETRTQDIGCGGGGGGGGDNDNAEFNPDAGQCSRKFVAQYVPHTNLLLILAVNNPTCHCERRTLSIEPEPVLYTYTDDECRRLLKTEKYRRRPEGCFNYHAQEKEIRQCGAAAPLDRWRWLATAGLLLLIQTLII